MVWTVQSNAKKKGFIVCFWGLNNIIGKQKCPTITIRNATKDSQNNLQFFNGTSHFYEKASNEVKTTVSEMEKSLFLFLI